MFGSMDVYFGGYFFTYLIPLYFKERLLLTCEKSKKAAFDWYTMLTDNKQHLLLNINSKDKTSPMKMQQQQ